MSFRPSILHPCWFLVHLLYQLLREMGRGWGGVREREKEKCTEISNCNCGFVYIQGPHFKCKCLGITCLFWPPSSPPKWGVYMAHCTFTVGAFTTLWNCLLIILLPSLDLLVLGNNSQVLLHSHMKDSINIWWCKTDIWGSVNEHVA